MTAVKPPSVDLALLRAFEALMRECHVTRAAERLDISQSSMSAALARLREIFKDELLIRTGTGLAPTEAARHLLPRVQEALAALDRVTEPAGPFDAARAELTFRLIVIDYIDLLVMPSVLQRLRREAPGVRIQFLQTNPRHFGEMLACGELDLALTYFPNPPDFLKGRDLFSDRFVTLCAAGHPALRQQPDLRQFCALPHVTIEPDSAQIYNVQIDSALAPHGLRRRVQMIKPSFLALPFVLESSDMVACVPARLARRMKRMAAVDMFDIPLDLPRFDVRMLWHSRTQNSPAHAWFRELVLECARQV